MEIKIFTTENWRDYELLDTGEREKLERFGKYIFVRPYEDAVWKKTLSEKEWGRADGKFWSSKEGVKNGWKMSRLNLDKWPMSYEGIKFLALPTPFRHLGFFPEQASHWDFIETRLRQGYGGQSKISKAVSKSPQGSPLGKVKFLNLFGYTGVASLFALRAGAEVTHVDASKASLKWAKENEDLNNFDNSMRIIEDDVMKFLEREIKRGSKYDCVIMDPPKFGRGPKGETWKIEKDLPLLLSKVQKVLSDKPLFVILTSYSTDSSSLSLSHALGEVMKDFDGSVEAGELCVLEKSNGRVISLANTAIWEKGEHNL